MSVIIAKKIKNGFVLAGDSQGTVGTHRTTVTKIFKAPKEENVFIGVVGRLRDANIVASVDSILDSNAIRRGNLDANSLVSYTVPELQKSLKEQGALSVDSGLLCWNSEIIIVYKDKAFLIDSDFCVIEIDDFAAIGAPQDFAYGAYAILKKFKSKLPKLSDFDLVKEIMKMTIEETIHVFYPIWMVDTSTTNADFIEFKGSIVEEKKSTKDSKEDE